MRSNRLTLLVIMIVQSLAAHAQGQVTEYLSFAQWQAATGTFTTIGFTEFPGGTFLTTQYESMGVTFPDGNDFIVGPSAFSLFPQDGSGLRGIGPIGAAFAQSATSVAVHYPGAVQIELYWKGDLTYLSTTQVAGPSPAGGFLGLRSTDPFDEIRVIDWVGGFINIDNLYFGPPIPAPRALVIVVVGLLHQARRRPC